MVGFMYYRRGRRYGLPDPNRGNHGAGDPAFEGQGKNLERLIIDISGDFKSILSVSPRVWSIREIADYYHSQYINILEELNEKNDI
jgi:hypothetical protein